MFPLFERGIHTLHDQQGQADVPSSHSKRIHESDSQQHLASLVAVKIIKAEPSRKSRRPQHKHAVE
jgi:hypothetical protein